MIMFQNAQRYKEYAIRFKRHWWSPWEWSKNEKGNNALFNFESASQLLEALKRQ